MAEKGVSPHLILPHSCYLCNFATADDDHWKRSIGVLTEEIMTAKQLGLTMVNIHPGSTKNLITKAEGILRIARAISEVQDTPGTEGMTVVIENTAHKGATGSIGASFEDLAGIIAAVKDKERVGVCLDTCHLFAAGHDIRTADGFQKVMEKFDSVVGLRYLKAAHINDSKGPFDSGQDHHDIPTKGLLGVEVSLFYRSLSLSHSFSPPFSVPLQFPLCLCVPLPLTVPLSHSLSVPLSLSDFAARSAIPLHHELPIFRQHSADYRDGGEVTRDHPAT
jgi:apurinic endonuclease APN1